MYVIRARFFSIGDDFDITDDDGRVVYHVDGKAFTVRDRLVIEDPDGTRWPPSSDTSSPYGPPTP